MRFCACLSPCCPCEWGGACWARLCGTGCKQADLVSSSVSGAENRSCHTCRVAYTPVVHCGSVRQTARVVSIQELPPPAPLGGGGCLVDGCDLACAITAAAALLGSAPDAPREGLPGSGPKEGACGDALLGAGCDAACEGSTGSGPQALGAGQGPAVSGALEGIDPVEPSQSHTPCSAAAADSSKPPSAAVGIPGAPAAAPGVHSPRSPPAGGTWQGEPVRREGGGGDLGCTARVVLEFCHRPEWLQAGARLVVRDRADGCTAGAGVIKGLAGG